MKECILCEKIKDDNEFSKEHIFPDSLLRNIINNFLITYDVCRNCNSNSGLFIDSPVVKYWFINQHKFDAFKLYGDLSQPETFSFIYIGEIQDFEYSGLICDKWFGPGKDEVYHFRKPFSKIDNLEAVQGLHPIRKIKKEDQGIAILILKTNNISWHKSLVKSFKKQFKKSKKYIYKGKINLRTDLKLPPKDILTSLNKMGRYKATMKVTNDTGIRFLCKLGIEMGVMYLNNTFSKSSQARLLRNIYRQKDPKERQKFNINTTGIINSKQYFGPSYKGITIKYVHTLALIVQNEKLHLYINFYGLVPASILITDNKEHWLDKFEKGILIFIAPYLNKIYDPIKICENCIENSCVVEKVNTQINRNMDNLKQNPPPNIK